MVEKYNIHAQPMKAKKLKNLLAALEADPVMKDDSDIAKQGHRQHEIRIRLLCLLLNLSNSDISGNDINPDEVPSLISQTELEKDILLKKEQELKKWKDILCEGETTDNQSSQWNDQDLSDWSNSDDEEPIYENINRVDVSAMENTNKFPTSYEYNRINTFLPGCSQPLQPPQKIPPPGNTVHAESREAKQWISTHVLPHYWIKQKDGKMNSNYPLALKSNQIHTLDSNSLIYSSADMISELDFYYTSVLGIPIEEKTVITEYQIIREVIWTLRYPQLSHKLSSNSYENQKSHSDLPYPLFRYDSSSHAFIPNAGWLCTPSISPESLSTLLEKFAITLSSLHHLAYFIRNVIDRPIQETSDLSLPPLTYEAYAAGLSNIVKLFSADLMDIEKIVREKKITFTLLDMQSKLSSWSRILNCLGRFHACAVTKCGKIENTENPVSNWQAAIRLLASLNEAISSEYKADMYAIYVDLFLKTIAPYFRIMGLWVSQGRLEDWRDEFVFTVNPDFHTSQMRLQMRYDEIASSDDDDLDGDSASDIQTKGLQESFWSRGFISRPYKSYLSTHELKVPEIFDWTLPRILNCGKSIEILTILQKQGKLEKSSALQFKYHVSFTQLYDEFLSNLKGSLLDHQIIQEENGESENKSDANSSEIQVKDVVDEDLSNYDPYLIAAFNSLLSKAGSENKCSDVEGNKKDILKLQNGGKDFLILSNYGLDPMKPLTANFETCLMPVISKHVDKAANTLLNLFRSTLNLEIHLNFVRNVYLMESGDLMSEFYNSIFKAVSQQLMQKSTKKSNLPCSEWSIDSLSLTVLLHDCLYRRPPTGEDMVERFTVKIYGTSDTLTDLESNIHIAYHVDWPMNIVLHSTSLTMYNKVFQFLLKVKHALWSLQEIDPKEISKSLENAQKLRKLAIKEYDFAGDSDDDESHKLLFPKSKSNPSKSHKEVVVTKDDELKEKRKIHRILVLRSWLLHFVSNIHSYLMTRVLHTTQLELQGVLREEGENKVNDLDDIIQSHNKYIERIHDRCFLHQSAGVLREAVIKVLNTCLDLHKLVAQFVNDYQDLDLISSPSGSSDESDIDLVSLKNKQYHIYKSTKSLGPDLLISDKLLTNYEANYFRSHQFLATTLRSLSQKRNIPHLEGLAAALLHSVPRRTHS